MAISSTTQCTLQAVQDFHSETSHELPLKKGDRIIVLEEDDSGWWKGKVGEKGNKEEEKIITISWSLPCYLL